MVLSAPLIELLGVMTSFRVQLLPVVVLLHPSVQQMR
jgi:hypothetical protein